MTAGPALLAVRRAVLDHVGPADAPLLVACSGGADSLALAAGTSLTGLAAAAVVVDHGLQTGSEAVAARAAAQCAGLGLGPVLVRRVEVSGPGGPEAAARRSRYAAIEEAAAETGAAAILLAHTLDDQAETVLLRLSRGAGARSLAGMAVRAGAFVRPLLGMRREQVRAACRETGLTPVEDPHNTDVRFARSRLRHHGLPALAEDLGQDVAPALARTARQLREDGEALDAWADEVLVRAGPDPCHLDIVALLGVPAAVRQRVIRRAVLAAGARPGSLSDRHVRSVEALVSAWRGQGPVDLPGRVRARRSSGTLVLSGTGPMGSDGEG